MKIYKDKAFWTGTYSGGPLVAGYLFAQNFKAFGEHHYLKATWIISVLVTVILFGGVFLIPETIEIPKFIIPLAYTALAYGIFKKYQGKKAEKHIKDGGEVCGWGRLILVSVIGLILTIGPIFTVAYLSDLGFQQNHVTKNYGLHQIEFDKTKISESEIDKIAKGFMNVGFFDRSTPKFTYISKHENIYQISLSVMKGIEHDHLALIQLKTLRLKMESFL